MASLFPFPVRDHEHKSHPPWMILQELHGKIQPVADGSLIEAAVDFLLLCHCPVAAFHPQGVPLGIHLIEPVSQQVFRGAASNGAVQLVHIDIPGIHGSGSLFIRDDLEHRICRRHIPEQIQIQFRPVFLHIIQLLQALLHPLLNGESSFSLINLLYHETGPVTIQERGCRLAAPADGSQTRPHLAWNGRTGGIARAARHETLFSHKKGAGKK